MSDTQAFPEEIKKTRDCTILFVKEVIVISMIMGIWLRLMTKLTTKKLLLH